AHLRDQPPADLRRTVLEYLDSPEAVELAARTRVSESAKQAGLKPVENYLGHLAPVVLRAFPIAMHFLLILLRDSIGSEINWDHHRHRNSVWDLKIAFHASHQATIGNVPVILVTDDPRFLRAARLADMPDLVKGRAKYLALLRERKIAEHVTQVRA